MRWIWLAGWLWAGLAGAEEPRVDVPQELRQPALPMSTAARDALRGRRWSDAVVALKAIDERELVGPQRADRAFLLAWALVRAGRAAEATPLLDVIGTISSAPPEYVSLLRGELLKVDQRLLEALDALMAVPDDAHLGPRAVVVRADLLRDLGRTADAGALLETWSARPDPAPGGATVLLLAARARGIGSEAAYPLVRRVWTWYPSSPEAAEATKLLAAWPDRRPTPEEWITRAERAMDAGMADTALASLAAVTPPLPSSSSAASTPS